MRIEYDLKYRDYLLFNIMHQLFSAPVQITYAGCAIGLFILLRQDMALSASILVAILGFVAIWVFQVLFNVVYLYLGKNRALFTRYLMQIEDDALCVETRFSKSRHYWPGLVKVIDRPGFVAVYLNAHEAHIIPDRAFPSLLEREKFLSSLREKLHAA